MYYERAKSRCAGIRGKRVNLDFELRSRVRKTIGKANTALKETQALYSQGLLPGTISRAYYAIFHSAAAVLLSRDLDIIKPSAVVPFFDREVVKRGLIESSYQRLFIDAYECYQLAEFDIETVVDQRQANSMVDISQAFVQRMEKYLQVNGWL